MRAAKRKRRIIRASAAGIFLGVLATQAAASDRHRYARTAQVPTGVVSGFRLGALLAGVGQSTHYVTIDDKQEPPVRCWWNRVDAWNGYHYIPQRTRVCQ